MSAPERGTPEFWRASMEQDLELRPGPDLLAMVKDQTHRIVHAVLCHQALQLFDITGDEELAREFLRDLARGEAWH